MGSIAPTVWPYMQIINPSLTVAMFGLFRGASSLANVIASGIAGALANRFKDTKILIIVGKTLNIVAAVVYLFIELKESFATWLFLSYDIIIGFSGGFASTYRTYIAMESKEEERSKAFGMTMFASSIGFLLGPLIQLLFTLIKYPGVSLFLGFHLNLYTAPVYLAMITTGIGLALLIFLFNGKLRTKKPKPKSNENTTEKISVQYIGLNGYVTTRFGVDVAEDEPLNEVHNVKIDKLAVFVLLVVKVSFDVNMLAITSLMTPYAMTAFEWTSANSVTYMSALMLAIGCASMFFSVGYMFFKFGERIPERIALVIALAIFLMFFVVTYPWAFYKTTIPYQHVVGEQAYYSRVLFTSSLPNFRN
uniref:MFS domain-containing protein n=1 Tax=Panagrellus redivivus TaxID=6233 RepID=A0A7E4VED7_PANRE